MRRDAAPDAQAGTVSLSPIEEEILRAVRRIRYGSVEITIHDSRVVQIEHREKLRFGKDGTGDGHR